MNHQRGWLRLWFLLSAVWGVILFTVAILKWPGHVEKIRLSEQSKNLLSAQTKNLFIKPASKPNPGRWVTTEDVIGEVQEVLKDSERGPQWLWKPRKGPRTITYFDTTPFQPIGAWVPMRSGQTLYLWSPPGSTDNDRELSYEAVKRDYENVQIKLLKHNQLIHIGIYFAAWLLSCISILLFGLGLRWVIIGFKERPN